jgi:hypothetical protein
MPFMEKYIPNRIVIYPKDIQNITGRKERTARKLLQDLKAKIGKGKNDFLTVEEFCNLMNFKEDHIKAFLRA